MAHSVLQDKAVWPAINYIYRTSFTEQFFPAHSALQGRGHNHTEPFYQTKTSDGAVGLTATWQTRNQGVK